MTHRNASTKAPKGPIIHKQPFEGCSHELSCPSMSLVLTESPLTGWVYPGRSIHVYPSSGLSWFCPGPWGLKGRISWDSYLRMDTGPSRKETHQQGQAQGWGDRTPVGTERQSIGWVHCPGRLEGVHGGNHLDGWWIPRRGVADGLSSGSRTSGNTGRVRPHASARGGPKQGNMAPEEPGCYRLHVEDSRMGDQKKTKDQYRAQEQGRVQVGRPWRLSSIYISSLF